MGPETGSDLSIWGLIIILMPFILLATWFVFSMGGHEEFKMGPLGIPYDQHDVNGSPWPALIFFIVIMGVFFCAIVLLIP